MDRDLLNRILNYYSLGNLIEYHLINQGFANENFRVNTHKGTFLLRNCVEQERRSILQEMKLMKLLRTVNFPAAYPVGRTDGTYLTELPEGRFVIYEFIEGSFPELNEQTVAETASMVAWLNSIKYKGISKKNTIHINACIELVKSRDFQAYPDTQIKDEFTFWTEKLSDIMNPSLPKGLIHGDVFPDNTFFQDNKLLAIIDFEEFAVDTLLFDVGMTIHGFCYKNNHPEPRLLKVFLDNYQRKRRLSSEELKSLPDYIRWAALGMTYWHLNKLVKTENQKQKKRVEELLERVKNVTTEVVL